MYILQSYVGGIWIAVLTESTNCPTPTLVVVRHMIKSERESWVAEYAEKNKVDRHNFRLVNVKDLVTIG